MPIARPPQQSGALFALLTRTALPPGESIDVAPDECCVLVRNGQVLGTLGAGRFPAPPGAEPAADLVFVTQAPVMGLRFGGPLHLVDPATGQPLELRIVGEYMLQPTDPGLLAQAAVSGGAGAEGALTYVQGTITQAGAALFGEALQSGRATAQTLSMLGLSLLPELARTASERLAPMGLKILAVSSCQVMMPDGQGGHGAQAVVMPPSPQQSLEAAQKRALDRMNPLNKDYSLQVKSGALSVGLSKDGVTFDKDRLENSIKNKVKDKLWGMVFGAALLGLMVLVLGGVGLYVWWSWDSGAAKPVPAKTPPHR